MEAPRRSRRGHDFEKPSSEPFRLLSKAIALALKRKRKNEPIFEEKGSFKVKLDR